MISKRLRTIASLIPKNKRIIDVGCDHGLLGIYLYQTNNNEVILSDINENCILTTKKNIKQLDIKVIQSDGLDNIDVKKDDILIIAGMGTHTILHILNNNKLAFINEMIIQTNNDYELLRRECVKKGFYIRKEIFLVDKNIPYILISFKRGFKKYSKYDYIFGPILKNNHDFQKYQTTKLTKILNKIPNHQVFAKLKIKNLLKNI